MSVKERFIDNQDGSITDSTTQLMWMKEDGWQTQEKWFTWDEALDLVHYFNGLKFCSFQDWRMPSHEEIVTIAGEEASNQDKYGKETHLFPIFPSGGQATVWLKGESGQEGTLFDFKNKEFRPLYKSKSGRMTVRLVRGQMLKECNLDPKNEPFDL
jgi:hypothetical protein